jgi:hypothetical protein
MKISFVAVLTAALTLGSHAIAHADTDIMFSLTGVTMLSGASANGTVTIDTTTGIVLSEDITTVENSTLYTFNGTPDTVNTLHDTYWDIFDAGGNEFELSVPPLSLVGYLGGPLCEVSALPGNCPDENFSSNGISHAGGFTPDGGSADFIAGGSLTPTPEPGSLLLFLTGASGISAAGYRRLRSRS